MRGVQEAVARVAAAGPAPAALPERVSFQPLRAEAVPGVAAVDGSHAVLVDNGSHWVVAHRAAAVHWPGAGRPPVEPVVTATSPDAAEADLAQAYAAMGLEPPTARTSDAFASALCALAEWAAARHAIRHGDPARPVLVDGALRGLPRHAQAMADLLWDEAAARRVRLLGVAKSSGLTHEGAALLPLLHAAGPAGAWSVAWDGTHVVRLHPRASHCFRVDAAPGDLGVLVPLARDAVYTGYPYPLAVAHNEVALTASHVAGLRGALESAARKVGPHAVAALGDFHAVLDRNVPA